jgi:hypothetical protein
MRGGHWLGLGWLLISLALLPGCSGERKLVTVSGTVTLDGEPVESGAILFVPVDGQAQTTGGEIRHGRYSVQVPPGAMKVSLSAPKVVGRKKIYPTPNSPEMPVTVEALPARYNEQTELTIEVTQRGNRQDFRLATE